MGRQRKPSKSDERKSEAPKAQLAVTPTSEKESEYPLMGVKATPRIVEEPKVTLPSKRNLGGMYELRCRLTIGGKKLPPGSKVELSDKDARHYLQFNAVSPLD